MDLYSCIEIFKTSFWNYALTLWIPGNDLFRIHSCSLILHHNSIPLIQTWCLRHLCLRQGTKNSWLTKLLRATYVNKPFRYMLFILVTSMFFSWTSCLSADHSDNIVCVSTNHPDKPIILTLHFCHIYVFYKWKLHYYIMHYIMLYREYIYKNR